MPTPPNVLTAAEASGDALAGPVLEELARRRPDLRWIGHAGPSMRLAPNHVPLNDVADLSGAGLVELVPALPRLISARRRLRTALRAAPPLAIFVDAPDLHLPLARAASGLGTRVVQLVAPQFWAWRPDRADFVARHVDLTLCLFRFEVEPLRSRGAAAHHVGHPVVDHVPVRRPASDDRIRVAVLPGSRPGEVARHLDPFLRIVREALAGRRARVVVPWRLPRPPPRRPGVEFVPEAGRSVLADADVALVAVGTAVLEAAALGVPTVAATRLHPLTAAVARRLVETPFVALPNILLGRRAVAEHVQDLGGVAADLRRLVDDLPRAAADAADLAESLRTVLGPPGFAARVADCVAPLLPRSP